MSCDKLVLLGGFKLKISEGYEILLNNMPTRQVASSPHPKTASGHPRAWPLPYIGNEDTLPLIVNFS